jgi:pilus assembly protein CpaB
MKPKTIVLMVVAVVCGLAASYMTSKVIAERNRTPAAPAEEEKVTVLVASKKVPMGTLIKDPTKYFVEKAYTKGDEPKKAIKSWDQLKDHRLNKPLSEDQFVTLEDLMDPKQMGIDALLPSGMRAVTLKVNAASIVAGFVQASSHVDVVQVVRHGDESTTQTILQNMLVLATDANMNRSEDKPAMMASTVTLAAKPEDAQKLKLAEAIGELSLALRPADDEDIVKLRGTKPKDLAKGGTGTPPSEEGGDGATGSSVPQGVPDVPATPGQPAQPEAKPEPAPAPPKTITQIIYNGESVTKTVFVLKEGEVSTQVEKSGPEREPRPEKKEPAKPEAAKSEPTKAEPEKKEPAPKTEVKKDGEPAAKSEGKK